MENNVITGPISNHHGQTGPGAGAVKFVTSGTVAIPFNNDNFM
jgi:hypothetical protein